MAHLLALRTGEIAILYCKAFSRATEITLGEHDVGVDRYGFDMSAMTPNGLRPVRLAFGHPVRWRLARATHRRCGEEALKVEILHNNV